MIDGAAKKSSFLMTASICVMFVLVALKLQKTPHMSSSETFEVCLLTFRLAVQFLDSKSGV